MAAACFARQPAPAAHPTDAGEVTFARDVAPIVFHSCASCHHPGEAAPFSLLTYDDTRRHARQIVEVTQKHLMPPWLPSEGADIFQGARQLTDDQRLTLQRWADAGAPEGDKAATPPAPTFTEGWQAGPPDLILTSPPYTLTSQDRDVFRNFVIPIKLDGPRWIQSIELRPDNPRVTHHARLGVDSSGESIRRDAEDAEPGYAGMAWGQDPDGQLVIWAPGMVADPGAPGVAWRLFPKTCLVLHTHMQPSGKPEVVTFRIGIRFAKEPPTTHPAMIRIGSGDIDIPPGADHHVVTDQYTLPIDTDIQTVFPHAHSLCREARVVAERPDGTRQPVITIEHFDENWHDSYRYRAPLRLPRGTRLLTTFVYDNTDTNLRNRNHPPLRTVYGSNVTDEMGDVYLQVAAAHADQRAVLMEDYKRYEMRSQIAGYRKALDLHPDDPWDLEGLATCYVGLGMPREAVPILERRVKTGPLEVFPVVGLGMALLGAGDVTRAETQLRQGLEMDGEYPLAWFGLGKVLLAQKKPEPAEQAFRRAVELAPGLAEAHVSLADLLMRRNQLDEAASVCSSAIGDSNDMASVYLKLGEIQARRRNDQQSLESFALARQAAPYTHPPKVVLAVYCIGAGEQEKGLTLLREARAENPDYPVIPLLQGQLAARQQQWPSARDLLATAAILPIPDNWPQSHRQRFQVLLHSERFRVAQQLQDLPLARDALAQWLKADPDNPQLRKKYEELQATPPR